MLAYPIPAPSHAYPAQLQSALAAAYAGQTFTVANEGWPGEMIGDGLRRLPSALTANVPEGLANLGHLYRVGRGVERDPVRAYALLRRAALFGNDTAALGVAQMLARGEGVETDLVEALAWARFATGRDGPSMEPARRLAGFLEGELDATERRAADELAATLDHQIAR